MRPLKLNIAMAEAEAWAQEHYGIEAAAAALPGDIDRNVRLTADDGSRWVLKLSHSTTATSKIECQHAVLSYLAETELRELVPRIVPDREGAVITRIRTAAGDEGMLRLVTYLPGKPLAKVENVSPELRREIGQRLGELDVTLADFEHPGALRHMVWDIVNVLELRPLLDGVARDLRPLIATGLDNFESRVAPTLASLPRSVIHNDANDYNLLVDHRSEPARLSGIIDFGDLVHTVTVAELAIACAYAMMDHDDPLAAAAELTEGYEKARKLEDLERLVLPDLIVARLCNSLLMSAQARMASPDDEYLQISERPAAGLLKRLIS